MPRNVRAYDHFCLLARALEQVGDRWTLLVVRDLLSGRKRFTDLMERLGGITPKTLTQRLRELEESGIVEVDREPGRREVWYALTPAGADLAPAVDALGRWGLRHAWRPPRPGERLHIEHLLRAMTQVVGRAADDAAPACWHFRFRDDGEYLVESDGSTWRLTAAAPARTPDVTVTATTTAWTGYLSDPAPGRAAGLGIGIEGTPAALARFECLLRAFPQATGQSPA